LGGTSQLGSPADFGGLLAMMSPEALLTLGPINLHPHISYRLSYGDQIQSSAGQFGNSFIHEFMPGMAFNLGEHWMLDYTPTLRWYSDNQFQNGTDHRVILTGNTTYQDWRFGFSQGFSLSSQPLVETAAQTDEEVWNTGLTAGYAFNSKVSLDMSLNQNLRFVGADQQNPFLTDSFQWSTMEWLNYQYVPNLTFSLGAGATYEAVDIGSDMMSEQVQARIMWRAGTRLDLSLSGGADIRQFLDSRVPGEVTPIYSLTASYKAFEQTTVFLAASQTISPSYYGGPLSQSTGLSAGLNQRLFGHLNLAVTGGYSINDYSATSLAGVVAPVENYDSATFGVSLGTTLLRRLSVSIFYNATYNISDSPLYDYSPTTLGFEFSTRF
jgi:hypothetical protein